MGWIALSLELEPESAEAWSDALLAEGAHSVALDGVDGPRPRIQALLAADEDAAALLGRAAAALGVAPPPHQLGRVDEEDWVRKSQAQFPPARFGERLWVGPTWHEPPPDVPAIVRLDPGMAFGTGTHPSTRLVLRFLAHAVRGGERVLDYGCGSGILAIAAAKLGAAAADAVDVDPGALDTAAENARANGVALRVALPGETLADDYDMVLANILAQPLILLAPVLARKTRPGGLIALSGLLASQAAEVAAAYEPYFACDTALSEDGWTLVRGWRR